jgi:hypothetical protein
MKRGKKLSRRERLRAKAGLKAGKGLERGEGPQRKTAVNPVNRARKKKRHARDFGGKAGWIRTLPCVVSGQRVGIQVAHVKSRGAGGDAKWTVPLRWDLHQEQHTVGILTFQERHRVDLMAEAIRLERMWQLRQGEG